MLNIPLPAGTGSVDFRAVYERVVFPALNDFKPDLVMMSAGFDAHRDDPLAQMELSEDDFAWVTQKLCAIANRHCGGRVVSVLEGGYNLPALKASAAAHLKALLRLMLALHDQMIDLILVRIAAVTVDLPSQKTYVFQLLRLIF